MYKPDDNDIDRLSREAAEHYNAPGTPAWDALRQTLDKELPKEKEKRRRGFLFFLLMGLGLCVAGSVVWYGVRMNSTVASINKTTDKKQTVPSNENTIAAKASDAVVKDNSTKDITANSTSSQSSDKQKAVTATIATGGSVSDNANGVAKNDAAKKITVSGTAIPANNSILAPSNAKHTATKNPGSTSLSATVVPLTTTATNHTAKNNTFALKTPNTAGNTAGHLRTINLNKKQAGDQINFNDAGIATTGKNKSNKYKNGSSAIKDKSTLSKNIKTAGDKTGNKTDADVTKNNTSSNDNNTISKQAAPVVDANNADTNNKNIAPKDAVADKPKPVAPAEKKDSAKTAAVKTKATSKNDKAILIGLTAGLDLSTVKFDYRSAAGYNIGLMGGYQFSKHWSVYTGFVYTKKNYKLNGSDYHPPKDYWTNTVNLATVDGYCRMWEVPLLARYNFNPSAKTSFFVSGGLSSYFMRKQAYNYDYNNLGGGWGLVKWTDDTAFNHIFSILDLSFGVQQQLGKHLNLQLEPYARIPLGGVGFGNIKLSSFGLNLTVQYKHPVKR